MIRAFWRRLIATFARSRSEHDLQDEVRFHLDTLADEYQQRGMTPEDARAAARKEFGGVDQMMEAYRERRGIPFVERTVQDLRYGLRILAKSPGFASVAILTLALGIGVNTAFFSVVNGLLLRPPEHVDAPDRLVSVFQTTDNEADKYVRTWSYPDYTYYRDYNRAFSGLAAFSPAFLTIELQGESQQVIGDLVSGNYFDVLGTKPFLGRLSMQEKAGSSDSPFVAVLSYELWRGYLASDPGVIGRIIKINRHPFSVIGITPKDMTDLGIHLAPALWVPVAAQPVLGWPPGEDTALQDRGTGWLSIVGRLKPGLTRQEALQNLARLGSDVTPHAPVSTRRRGIALETSTGVPPFMRGAVFGIVGMVQVLGALLLLIPCANVAGLMLARGSTRHAEISIRCAIGAGRSRIIRQLLTESMLIGLCGAVTGFFLAFWLMQGLAHLRLPFGVPVHVELRPDARVLAVTLLTTLITVLLFGMGPALRLSNISLAPTAGRLTGTSLRRYSWRRRFLVISQISISLLFLIGAGLCVRSLRNAQSMDLGFNTENTLEFEVSPRLNGYSEVRAGVFYRQLWESLRSTPGVQSASLAALAPLSYGEMQENIACRGDGKSESREEPVSENLVSPGYFETLGIRILRGRGFRDVGERQSIVVNETFVRRFFPGRADAIGRELTVGLGRNARLMQVVGIAKDAKYRTLGEPPHPFFYALFTPAAEGPSGTTVLIRTRSAPGTLIPTLGGRVKAIDPSLPTPRIETMREHIGSALWLARATAALFAGMGLLATFLAVIGLYGSVAYSVTRRANEIGVRMALGAQHIDILKMVEGEGLLLATVGIGIGLCGAFGLTRLLAGLLYGLSTTDPVTFAGASLLFTVIALAASYIPARRATRVDPLSALRSE